MTTTAQATQEPLQATQEPLQATQEPLQATPIIIDEDDKDYFRGEELPSDYYNCIFN